jgi:adenylate kinase family enzyme
VIDGNFTDAIAPRLAAADLLIYLDAPRWLSIARVLGRIASSYGRVRPDAAPGCPERIDLDFLRYVWSWNRERRARSLATVAAFPRRKAVVRTAADRRRLMAGLGQV